MTEPLPPIPARSTWRSADTATDAFDVDIDLEELRRNAAGLASTGRSPIDVGADELPLGTAAAGIDVLREQLADGSGLAIVRGFPVGDAAPETIELMFWRIGLALGTPTSQSVMGEVLGHVIDTSDRDPNARAYRRNEELTPHTDPADYLGFLCLQPAAVGGESTFVSALQIHEILRRKRPDLLVRLYRGFHYSRFGEQADDEEAITPYRVPVYSVCDGAVSCRLVRQYIEIAAHESPAIDLDDTDREALDLVDALARDPGLAISFTLAAGDVI